MKILIAGDFCSGGGRVAKLIDKKEYSFFKEIKNIIKTVDYSIVNFECPIVKGDSKPIAKCGPALRTQASAINAIKYAGFNGVTLANNHFRDFGDEGCLTTINELRKQNIDYVGGGANIVEAQRVLYKTINEKKLAIVNFCENEFSIATTESAGSAPLDSVDNYHQIKEARKNADFVLVIVHGGHEMYQLPSPRMKKLYRFFVEIGADAVINHHQHCYSGYEYYNGKPIVYGLGNFCFDWEGKQNSIWNEGYCVMLETESSRIELYPYIQCNDTPTVKPMCNREIDKFNSTIARLNKIIADDNLLQDEFDKWIKQQTKGKLITFTPYFHRYLNIAAIRGWIPMKHSSVNNTCKMLNNIACESHRDITIAVFNDKINQNNHK